MKQIVEGERKSDPLCRRVLQYDTNPALLRRLDDENGNERQINRRGRGRETAKTSAFAHTLIIFNLMSHLSRKVYKMIEG